MSSKKAKKETFETWRAYRNLPDQLPRIVKSYLVPSGALLANSGADHGAPQFQYFCKFANQLVLSHFLCYLAGGTIPRLAARADREESIDHLIEHVNAFKQFYNSNPKAVEELPEGETNQIIAGLSRKYLYLGEVKETYKNTVKIQKSTSKVALFVVKNGGNLTLVALARNPDVKPDEKEMKGKEKQNKNESAKEEEEGEEEKVPFACRLFTQIWLVVIIGLIIYSGYLNYSQNRNIGLLQILNLVSSE